MNTSEYGPLGERIRSRRKQLGMTQEELAEQSNLSVNYISKIERTQDQNISFEVLANIAHSLNITIAEFIGKPPITPSNADIETVQERKLLNRLRQMDRESRDKAIDAILQLLDLQASSKDNRGSRAGRPIGHDKGKKGHARK